MPHPLEPFIASRGLRRAALYLDTACALHRCAILGSSLAELDALTPEQVLMALVLMNEPPGTDAWSYAERRVGFTLPAPTESPNHAE